MGPCGGCFSREKFDPQELKPHTKAHNDVTAHIAKLSQPNFTHVNPRKGPTTTKNMSRDYCADEKIEASSHTNKRPLSMKLYI